MKKIIFAVFLLSVTVSSSFAASVALVAATYPKGFTPSNNVVSQYESAGTPKDRYSIATKHSNGDKTFGTVSGSGTIWYSTAIAPGTALADGKAPTLPGTATDSTVTGGAGTWVAM